MTNQEKIQIEIEKQINAGFNAKEIRQNLLLQNFTDSEINEGLKKTPATPASENSTQKFGVLSLLLSVFFIIRGIMYMNKYPAGDFSYTLGIIFILLGTAGFIIKGVDIARR
jgi:hypothetical protein